MVIIRNVPNIKNIGILRKSFIKIGVHDEYHGTHFHDKKIQCNINGCVSNFKVNKMRIVGDEITGKVSWQLLLFVRFSDLSDKVRSRACVEKFPGIPQSS